MRKFRIPPAWWFWLVFWAATGILTVVWVRVLWWALGLPAW